MYLENFIYDGKDTNMGTIDYKIPDRELELLARMLLPEIKKFFADEDIQKEFELWQAQRKNGIASNKE